jgi:O-acetyl-ADP-ribose deacetylase (regulator of RNase III)
MHEIVGELWEEHARGAVVAITTNGMVNRVGRAVMPSGCARQARDRFPDIIKTLGAMISHRGNHVFDLGHQIVSFPVEKEPYQRPELHLIEQSCQELLELADYKGWKKIVVPRPGCGCGALEWKEVKNILLRHFDERFYVITNKEE